MAKWQYVDLERKIVRRDLSEGGAQFRLAEGIDPALIDDLVPARVRKTVKAHIRMEQRRRMQGGVLVGTNWFDSDTIGRMQVAILTGLSAALPANTKIEDMDDAQVDVTPALLADIGQAYIAHDKACRQAARAHKQALTDSLTPETYDWHTDWPAIYGEP